MNESITVERTLKLISQKLNRPDGREIYQASLKRFLDLFGIHYFLYIEVEKKWEHWRSGLKLKSNFVKFLLENVELIGDFDTDFYNYKTYLEIAEKIGLEPLKTKNTILELIRNQTLLDYFSFSNVFENLKDLKNNTALKLISSYQIQLVATGKLPELKKQSLIISNAKNELSNIISKELHRGFEKPKVFSDVFDYIIEELQPIFDSESAKQWGLEQPGGILLYGPPGCGKTYWANKINEILEFELHEVPRSLFGSTYVDGAMKNLKELFSEIENKQKLVLFFDEFDSIAAERGNSSLSGIENAKVVNTLLQEIPKLIERKIVIVAASNFLSQLDPAVIRPGRFDLKLPIFSPSPDERVNLLIQFLLKGIDKKWPLYKIIDANKANCLDFWSDYKNEMNLFSVSLIKDLAVSIKRKIKSLYIENGENIEIDDVFITEVLTNTKSKLTAKDVEYYANFFLEIESVSFPFSLENRKNQLRSELDKYYRGKENPPKPIGFRIPDID